MPPSLALRVTPAIESLVCDALARDVLTGEERSACRSLFPDPSSEDGRCVVRTTDLSEQEHGSHGSHAEERGVPFEMVVQMVEALKRVDPDEYGRVHLHQVLRGSSLCWEEFKERPLPEPAGRFRAQASNRTYAKMMAKCGGARERGEIESSVGNGAKIVGNVVVSAMTAFAVLYFVCQSAFGNVVLSASVGAIGSFCMLIVESVLFVIYGMRGDKRAERGRARRREMGPFGEPAPTWLEANCRVSRGNRDMKAVSKVELRCTPTLEQVLHLVELSAKDARRVLTVASEYVVGSRQQPVTAEEVYLKLRESGRHSAMLETREELTSSRGHFTMMCTSPEHVLEFGPGRQSSGDSLRVLEERMRGVSVIRTGDEWPSLASGGYVGFISYDCAMRSEPALANEAELPDELGLPEAVWMRVRDLVVFCHETGSVYLTSLMEIEPAQVAEETRRRYSVAEQRIEAMRARLDGSDARCSDHVQRTTTEWIAPMDTLRSEYERRVSVLLDRIDLGDCIQVVPSRRCIVPIRVHPFSIYTSLRALNTSHYSFFVDCVDFQLLGSSPESLVVVNARRVTVRPIAGTRPRGRTPDEDDALADELRHCDKEIAEHVMLVDLSRNDVCRVCEPISIRVTRLMRVEKYSAVMHLVSQVEGTLLPNLTPFDAFRSVFPAGTVTGAPKVKAMQWISQLERVKRNVYAGAVGYFSLDGNVDTCIAIRTAVTREGFAILQAGAGVVHDSVPSDEYNETTNKLRALFRAIKLAHAPLDARQAHLSNSAGEEDVEKKTCPHLSTGGQRGGSTGREHDTLTGREHDALTGREHDALTGHEHDALTGLTGHEHDTLTGLTGHGHDTLTGQSDSNRDHFCDSSDGAAHDLSGDHPLPVLNQLPMDFGHFSRSTDRLILLIDNIDSFTYNVYQFLCYFCPRVVVLRNSVSLEECRAVHPTHLVISPGPGTPKDSHVSIAAIRHFSGKTPILGICMGLECIVEAFGGEVTQCGEIIHGKTSLIHHDGKRLFSKLPREIRVTRYHSLAANPDKLPTVLSVTSRTLHSGVIMGVRHNKYTVEGVQFHPESVMSEGGLQMTENFVTLSGAEWATAT